MSTTNWQYKYYKLKLKLRELLNFGNKNFYAELLVKEQNKNIYPKVVSIQDSLNELIASNKSIARYGDGEFTLCFGEGISFQSYDNELQNRLKEILKDQNQKNCMVCIVDAHVEMKTEYSIAFWARNIKPISKLLVNKNNHYYDANVFRHLSLQEFQKIKQVWDNKDVIFVVGKDSRFVFDKDLFGNIKQHQFIYGKAKDAWSDYYKILKEVLEVQKEYKNEAIVLISLGPCATVLAFDLSKQNIRALDIGHISNQYLRLLNKGVKPEAIAMNEAK